ncbi:unnamed protein product [Lactuca virosa]|uniref:Uncharacterized protein n=1 Tax=Lactuca virosa TaxID=75947 RepID=A0AAU9NTI0_9ASTR|nr:unnamed protein product [Lactuca virosa]
MTAGGPSPVVPSLILGILSLVICSSTVENLGETISSLTIGKEAMVLLPIILLLLIHLIPRFLPTRYNSYSYQSSSNSHFDSEGLGLGYGFLLLVLLFIILCHVFA